jgi:hypothetical protein
VDARVSVQREREREREERVEEVVEKREARRKSERVLTWCVGLGGGGDGGVFDTNLHTLSNRQ